MLDRVVRILAREFLLLFFQSLCGAKCLQDSLTHLPRELQQNLVHAYSEPTNYQQAVYTLLVTQHGQGLLTAFIQGATDMQLELVMEELCQEQENMLPIMQLPVGCSATHSKLQLSKAITQLNRKELWSQSEFQMLICRIVIVMGWEQVGAGKQ